MVCCLGGDLDSGLRSLSDTLQDRSSAPAKPAPAKPNLAPRTGRPIDLSRVSTRASAVTASTSATTPTLSLGTLSTFTVIRSSLQTLTVGSAPGPTTLTASATGGWLSLKPSSNQTPATVEVAVLPSASAFSVGNYPGSATISSNNATNSPQIAEIESCRSGAGRRQSGHQFAPQWCGGCTLHRSTQRHWRILTLWHLDSHRGNSAARTDLECLDWSNHRHAHHRRHLHLQRDRKRQHGFRLASPTARDSNCRHSRNHYHLAAGRPDRQAVLRHARSSRRHHTLRQLVGLHWRIAARTEPRPIQRSH